MNTRQKVTGADGIPHEAHCEIIDLHVAMPKKTKF